MYGITVMEFLELFVDTDSQQFEIWSNEREDVLFIGYLTDIPDDMNDELLQAEVSSVDNIQYEGDCITININ